MVEDGNITIGAVGGSGDNYDKYMPTAGCFFKADNFRVKYICNVANGRIKLAAEDIKTKAALSPITQEHLLIYQNMKTV